MVNIFVRYVSPAEASWRIFGFAIHHSSIAVQRLSFHLEGEHPVTINSDDDVDDVLEKESNQTSQLLEYFKMCERDEEARKLTFIEFPLYHVWNTKPKHWSKRKRNKAIGRMHFSSPSAGQSFYMRILLNKVRGATCFEDLKRVDGVLYPTYQDACYALGLLDDDKEYIDGIKEIGKWGTANYMRRTFVWLLCSQSLSKPMHVWSETWDLLSEDILEMQRRIQQRPGIV